MRGAVPAGQAGGHVGKAEGRGGLFHPVSTQQEPEVVQGGGGGVSVRQLGLAVLGLLSAAALYFWILKDSQSSAVVGPGQTGTTQCTRHQRLGNEDQQRWQPC